MASQKYRIDELQLQRLPNRKREVEKETEMLRQLCIKIERLQKSFPQNVPFCHLDYFRLKTILAPIDSRKKIYLSLNYLETL